MNENDYDTVESSKSLVNSMHMNSDIFFHSDCWSFTK